MLLLKVGIWRRFGVEGKGRVSGLVVRERERRMLWLTASLLPYGGTER
jgi:hypothetical protein